MRMHTVFKTGPQKKSGIPFFGGGYMLTLLGHSVKWRLSITVAHLRSYMT